MTDVIMSDAGGPSREEEPTEPIDYRKMTASQLPPWIDPNMLVNSYKGQSEPSGHTSSSTQPRTPSLHINHAARMSLLSQPKGPSLPIAKGPADSAGSKLNMMIFPNPRSTRPRVRPYLMPFMSLGPDYKDIFCISGTSILLQKTENNLYILLGSFTPSLPSMFKALTKEEETILAETSKECGFQIAD